MKDGRHEQFADWITRYYSSHKYIPDGHSDGELIGKLIRCKDCKYWETDDDESFCSEWGAYGTGPESYCSFAKRKE